jgi:1,2-diacylglycerol 3-beta-galactosyltransferase
LREILSEIIGVHVECLDVFRDVVPEYDIFKKLSGTSGVDIYNNLVLRRSWSTLFWPMFALATLLFICLRANAAASKLRSLLAAYDPDLVISVAPFANSAIAKGIRSHSRKVPFLTVMVDTCEIFPRTWMQDRDQTIFVPTEFGHTRLTRAWRSSNVIRTQGLPISQEFSRVRQFYSKMSAKRLIGLRTDRPTVIFSFGGRGTDRIWDYACAIDERKLGIQSIFVCGTNKHVFNRLRVQKAAAISRGDCCVFGLRQDIPILLRASDLFVGKPGPFTVYECLEMGLPMFLELNRKTLIQERYNARMVSGGGYGATFGSVSQLRGLLEKFIDNRIEFAEANPSSALTRDKVKEVIVETLKA